MESNFEFSEIAVDHARNPRNCGSLESYNGCARITGPCGDTMESWIDVVDEQIRSVAFTTDGCGSSRACGSMATTLAAGKTLEEAACIEQHDILDALGGFPEEAQHCALLAANTLRAACADYEKDHRQPGFRGGRSRTGKAFRQIHASMLGFLGISSSDSQREAYSQGGRAQ
jgi:nitrogen fixation protein NifU and related proteins